jgi:hypothetical protein
MNQEIDEISRALRIAEANIQTALNKELATLHAKGIPLTEDDVSVVFKDTLPLQADVQLCFVVRGKAPHA